MLPVQRTAGEMSELSGLPVAQATVINASEDAAVQLTPIGEAIAGQLQTAPVVQPPQGRHTRLPSGSGLAGGLERADPFGRHEWRGRGSR